MPYKIDYSKKSAQIIKTDKALIDELLSMNHDNRNIRKNHLYWLRTAIKAGQFILTGQGISVSKDNVLIDGQHRLTAIRDAGYPSVEILLITGLEDKAKIYIDQHARRSAADMLKLVVDKDVTPRMAAVMKLHMMIKETPEGFTFGKHAIDLEVLVKNMQKNERLIGDIFETAGDKARVGVICALFHYAQRTSRDEALGFSEKVRTGTNLAASAPAYRLREYILGRKVGWARTERSADYMFAVTACIANTNNEKITNFRQSSSWDNLPKKK